MALRTEVVGRGVGGRRQPPHDAMEGLVKKLRERISELERLTDILSRGKYDWETTFDAIQAPVSLLRSDYTIQRANLALAAVAGEEITKITGQKCYQVFAGRQTPCENCPAQQALTRDWPVRSTLKHPIRDRDYEVHAYPFAGARGGAKALVMHYRDVTEERRLHQELIQQEKMAAIGMLAGGVAHEINNPLGGILAFTQLLIRDHKGDEQIHTDLEEIERAALRCKKIVQDLLDFSRASSGHDKLPVRINDILERSFGFLKREFLSLNITLVPQLAMDLPEVVGDANRLQQVLLNIMTNATQAMPKGGTLTVATMFEPIKEQIGVVVRDTGMGIPPENLDRVFDPFYTTKAPGKGTGLGLSISYRIVRDHGGTITVASTLEKGTTFTVWLPAIEPAAVAGSPADRSRRKG
ncbi:MAG: PAS domain-containing protein [Deltaproteobacteria bacterium]|nr:PAS domain-containing protein [Deltaproteobacteria bacterium]